MRDYLIAGGIGLIIVLAAIATALVCEHYLVIFDWLKELTQ